MPRFESRHLTTPGATIAIRHYAGQGDPIVLLHGGPGMGDYFDALPELLSPPYQVVSYDQRGCGQSACRGSFAIEDQIADLDAIRSHHSANRLHLFGHSWGGLLAQLYAKAHAERVASLVLCCAMANTGRRVSTMESQGIAQRVIAKPKRSPLAWAGAGLLMQCPGRLGDLGFGCIMKQLLPHYTVRPELAPQTYDVWRASKRAWRGTNAAIKVLGDDYLDRLDVAAPVLIVQGEHDVIRETNAVLANRFPSAVNVWIPNAAHFPWLEQPDAFARTILDFYRETVFREEIASSGP